MFRAPMCPSSGETTVFLRHFVDDCLADSHPQRITSTKYGKNTVVSPDDGHIVARNMRRLINIQRINCAPSWVYLEDYAEMHGQQNIKFTRALLSITAAITGTV